MGVAVVNIVVGAAQGNNTTLIAAHCSNQHAQTWLYDGVEGGYTRVLRKNKKGQWVHKGVRYVEDKAVYFYDYNF